MTQDFKIRRKTIADRVLGAWHLIVFGALVNTGVDLYPAARDIYDRARGVMVSGALPRIAADYDISEYLPVDEKIWGADHPVPPPPPPRPDFGGMDAGNRATIDAKFDEVN